MQLAGLSLPSWTSPAPAARVRRPPVPLSDRVELSGNPTEVLTSPTATPAQLRQALGQVALTIPAGHMVPSPALQAALQLMQRLNTDPQADSDLKAGVDDQLSRWYANSAFTVNQATLEELTARPKPFTVIGKTVFPEFPEKVPEADLCALLDQVENPPPFDPQADPNTTPLAYNQFWVGLHAAGKAELAALADLMQERQEPMPGILAGQMGELHRRVLACCPERADESYYQRYLKPGVLSGQSSDFSQLVLHFYGPDRLLGELLPGATDQLNRCSVGQGLEQLELYLRAGQRVRPELMAQLAQAATVLSAKFDRHDNPIGPALVCLAQQLDSVSDPERMRLQQALLDHPTPCWPIGLALDKPATVRVASGTPELVANLWDNCHNQVAQALLVGSELNEMEWARLGLLVAHGEDRESRLIREAYQRRNLSRKLLQLEAGEATRQLSEVATRTGVDDAGRADQILMQRVLADFPAGAYPALSKAANWIFDTPPFVPIVKQAALEGTTRQTFDELEGLLARQGKGIIGGHERTLCQLYQNKGKRSLDEAEQRFNRVGSLCPAPLAAGSGGPQRLALLRLLESCPTEDLLAPDNPLLKSLGRLLSRGDADDTLKKLEMLNQGLRRDDPAQVLLTFSRIVTRAEGASQKELDLLIERASQLSPAALDRGLDLVDTPLTLNDALELGPVGEELHSERGPEAFQSGLKLLGELSAVKPEERRASAEVGLKCLLSGESLETARLRMLRSMVVGEVGPTSGIERSGDHLRVGGQRLRIRQRA